MWVIHKHYAILYEGHECLEILILEPMPYRYVGATVLNSNNLLYWTQNVSYIMKHKDHQFSSQQAYVLDLLLPLTSHIILGMEILSGPLFSQTYQDGEIELNGL